MHRWTGVHGAEWEGWDAIKQAIRKESSRGERPRLCGLPKEALAATFCAMAALMCAVITALSPDNKIQRYTDRPSSLVERRAGGNKPWWTLSA